MSKLEDIDPIFAKDGKGSEEPQYRLEDIDPIFKLDDKKSAVTAPASDRGFASWLMNKIEPKTAESAAGAVAGAIVNPRLQSMADKVAASKAATSQGMTPVQKWAEGMGYGDRGQATYAKAHEAEMGTRKGAAIRNPATGQTFKPEFNVPKPPIVNAPPAGALQQAKGAMTTAGDIMSKFPKVSGALAGAGAVSGFQDAANRYQAGDYPGAAIAGAGGVGSLASMIPHPLTRAVGAGVGMASPAALMVLDKMRQQTVRQPQQSLQNTDQMGNPLP